MLLFAGPGTISFYILDRIPSPRSYALGEAYAGLDGDPTWLFLNPSSVIDVSTVGFSLLYSYQAGIHQGGGALLSPVSLKIGDRKIKGNVGVAVGYLYTSEEAWDQYNEPAGTVTYSESLVELTAQRTFWGAFNFGFTAKFVNRNIAGYTDWGVAGDFSALTAIQGVGVGLVFKNFGYSPGGVLPLSIRIGVGFVPLEIAGFKLNVALDVSSTQNIGFEMGGGVEVSYADMAFVRLGYSTAPSKDVNILSGMTFGAGVKLSWISFDYALGYHSMLGFAHMASFSFSR